MTWFTYIWDFFIIISIIFTIYVFFYFKFIGNFNEVFWKIFYILTSFLGVFLYFYVYADTLLILYLKDITEAIFLKDLQDLVNISLDLAYFLSLYFISPLIIVLAWKYFSKNETESLKNFLNILLFLFIYFFIIFKFYLETDLFLSSWYFLNKQKTFIFDFQPDLSYMFLSYFGDFLDFSFFFICYFFLFIWFNKKKVNLLKKNQLKFLFIFRIFLVNLNIIIALFFWGGESFFRDLLLICLTFICWELYFFYYIFLFNLKRKKL